jgi:hypothetical protein
MNQKNNFATAQIHCFSPPTTQNKGRIKKDGRKPLKRDIGRKKSDGIFSGCALVGKSQNHL